MLPSEVVHEEDAIEKYFCKEFKKLPTFPMGARDSELLVRLLLGGDLVIPQEEKPFLIQVIEKRVEHCFTYTINSKAVAFIAALTENPGTAIMYLTYFQYVSKQFRKQATDKLVTLELICEVFPMGFPSKEDLHNLWDSIKVKCSNGGSDNLLDYASALKSIL